MYGKSDARVIVESQWSIKHTALIGCGLGMLLATGCATQVLSADFNKYAGTPSAAALEGPIPGMPEGDSIENAEHVEVVVDEVIKRKSARVRGQIDLLPAPHSTPDIYAIDWVGMRSLVGNEGTSTISFLDEDGDAALVLEFDGADGRLYWRTGDEPDESTMLGAIEHEIDITIDMRGGGGIDVSFKEPDSSRQQYKNLDFLSPEFDELARIHLEGAENATYYLADLDVVAKTRMRR